MRKKQENTKLIRIIQTGDREIVWVDLDVTPAI